MDVFKQKLKAVNARPMKKIAEAKARKKMKSLKRWERVKAQAEQIAAGSFSQTGLLSESFCVCC